jgi:uncharacterized protein Yka (UPF0111/DUF47 family)
MPQLTSELRAAIEARIAVKEAQLDAANTTYSSLLSQSIYSYKLDTSAADQWVQRQKISELQQAIESLESEIDLLYRRLNGTQVVSVRLRRKW